MWGLNIYSGEDYGDVEEEHFENHDLDDNATEANGMTRVNDKCKNKTSECGRRDHLRTRRRFQVVKLDLCLPPQHYYILIRCLINTQSIPVRK